MNTDTTPALGTMPTPAPGTKWAKALSIAQDVSDDLDKVMVGALCGSQADKVNCLAYLKRVPAAEITRRQTTGSATNEARWQQLIS